MYLDNKNYNNTYFFDIETNSLTPDTIWCVVILNKGTRQVWKFINDGSASIYHELRNFFLSCPKDSIFVGHNAISFDGPVLGKLCGFDFPLDRVVDTLCLSYLYNPALEGGHSLESYGYRFKYPKGDHSDWSKFSQAMLDYCERDVLLTEKVYDALITKMSKIGFSELSCEIEHKTRQIIDRQQENGFWFDIDAARALEKLLQTRLEDLGTQVHQLFPPVLSPLKSFERKFKKDGSDTANYLRHCSEFPVIRNNPDGTYDCLDWVEFNIGSPKQRLDRLLELGFEPTSLTKKGNPKVDEDALVAFAKTSGKPEVAAMANWLVVKGRLNMLAGNPETGSKGWIDYALPTHRIHGKVFSCGATTRRMRHREPNSSNIPSGAKAQYGHECRALWGVEPNRDLLEVGIDASGLETVGLLHYLQNKEAEAILTKPKPDDVHTANARSLTEVLGREIDREWGSKTCVPLNTRILTKRGWKHYDELIIGEDVLGYNQETKQKEWTKLLDINVCEDEVFKISNSYKTFYATMNHRWFVRQRKKSKKSYSRVNGTYMEEQVRTTAELNTESNIILNAPFNDKQDTESKIHGLDGKYDVDWEQRVLNMSHNERVQFVQGFMLADGYINTDSKGWIWSQNKTNVAEGLLLASYLVHHGALFVSERKDTKHEMIVVSLSKKGHITNQGNRLEKTSQGVQKVWCPRTALGSWVMRQGYHISITGNSWYAWLYGAYPKKLGEIVKGPPSDGDKIIETFFKNVPGLKSLIDSIKWEWKANNGLLKCIDGGYVRCPSENAALNYKIQSLGAIVMKMAAILLDRKIKEKGLYAKLIGTIHDEWQFESKDIEAEELGRLAVISITQAAEELNFNTKLNGEYKIGKNWSECH